MYSQVNTNCKLSPPGLCADAALPLTVTCCENNNAQSLTGQHVRISHYQPLKIVFMIWLELPSLHLLTR